MTEGARQDSRDQRDAYASAPLRLRLLGEFQLIREGTAIDTVSAQRRQLLIAYLALHRGTVIERAELAAILWPESTDRQARTNLRHLLYTLRRSLPEYDLLVEDTGTTLMWRVDAPCAVDTAEFFDALEVAEAEEQQVDAGAGLSELQRAIACYAGELLPGHDDEWVLIERERIRREYLATLERAAEAFESRRDYAAAIEHCRQLLREDPLRESAYRTLMRLHALNGDRSGIVQTFESCVVTLQEELGIEPASETEELYQSLLAGVSRGPPPAEDGELPPPLIGRYAEWSRLEEIWREAAANRSQMVLLSGEAGAGKTRLAEELIDWLRRQGATTLSARCYSAEGSLSFAPIVAWVRDEQVQAELSVLDDPWLSEVARLVPEIRSEWPDLPRPSPLTEGWQRQRLFEALARAVLNVRQPLALLIDDLQWCDRDTFEWLRFLLRFQPDGRLLLIGTLRLEELTADHPLLSLVISLRHDRQLAEVMLEALSELETARLAASLLGREVTVEDTRRLYGETEGNPLFIVEMMRAGLHEERKPQDLPPTVQAVISGRLGLLSEPALEIVRLAATIGREFSVAQLAAAGIADEDRLVDSLDELSQRRIVREQGGGTFDFTHDKLREVTYDQLGEMRQRMLHHRVALAIESDAQTDADSMAGQLAYHFERAGLAKRAATYYLRAADHARQIYANHEAIRLYGRGIALVEPDREGKRLLRRLLEGLGDVLLLAGAHQRARDAFIRAIDADPTSDGDEIARLQHKLGNSLKAGGSYPEALAAYTAAESSLGSEPEDLELWIDLQMDRMRVHYGQGDWQAMQAIVDVVEPRIERLGTSWQRAELVRIHSNVGFQRDRYVVSDQAIERIKEAAEIAREGDDISALANVQFSLGFSTLWHGDSPGALAELRPALDLARQLGNVELQVLNLTYLAIASRRLEQIDDTERYAQQALELATNADMPSYRAAANANLAWLAWWNGDLDTGERLGRSAVDDWRSGSVYPFRWLALWPLIDIATGRGDTAEASSLAGALLDETQQRLPDELEASVEAALEAEHPGEPLRRALKLARGLGYL